MALNNFFKFTDGDADKKLDTIIKKLKKDTGLKEEIAKHKAEEIVFKPKQLEKIKLNTITDIGMRPSLKLFFNNKEELKIIGKYFNVNWNLMEIGDASFLVKLLKKLEE